MTTLRKTPPKMAILGITLTVLALASGTLLSGTPAAGSEPALPAQPAVASPVAPPAPSLAVNC
ncbi:MAG: hypothetical protein R3E10_04505 [Gemmatimonadota bacterium]